jgi:elongation factor Ts
MKSLKIIKDLRQITGAGILDCQKALQEANNDLIKAEEILRKKGQKIVDKKLDREAKEGVIGSYVHANNKIGVLIELLCETDFVARNKEFKELAHDLAMQVAAANPQWIKPIDVPSEILKKEKEIIKEGLPKDKPTQTIEKITEGKLQKFYSQFCLEEQMFIKDDKLMIKDLIQKKIVKLGENIQIKRFIRFEI